MRNRESVIDRPRRRRPSNRLTVPPFIDDEWPEIGDGFPSLCPGRHRTALAEPAPDAATDDGAVGANHPEAPREPWPVQSKATTSAVPEVESSSPAADCDAPRAYRDSAEDDRQPADSGEPRVAGDSLANTILNSPGPQAMSFPEDSVEPAADEVQDALPGLRPQAQKGPRGAAEAPAIKPAADDIDANETVRFCTAAVHSLAGNAHSFTPELRWELVKNSLAGLYNDVRVPPSVLGDIADTLHELAPQEYARWVRSYTKRGTFFIMGTRPFPPRLVNNILALFRPRMIAELELETLSDIAVLDGALAAYSTYLHSMLEVKARREFQDDLRERDQAASDAQVSALAERSLKLFTSTIERLRPRSRSPVLTIRNAEAVQVNAYTAAQPALGR